MFDSRAKTIPGLQRPCVPKPEAHNYIMISLRLLQVTYNFITKKKTNKKTPLLITNSGMI